jgi:hypothetical protein
MFSALQIKIHQGTLRVIKKLYKSQDPSSLSIMIEAAERTER